MSERRLPWSGVGLAVVGALLAGHAIAERSAAPAASAAPPKKSCCLPKHATATPATCPIRTNDQGWVDDEDAGSTRFRRALRDGVFRPWIELGRAPTPEEIAARLKLPRAATNELLDQLEACGQASTVGILRVPQSSLIAVAWPLSNVPTGIVLTLESSKPVFSRCASDALGTSQMLGKRASVDAIPRDGGPRVHVVVDGNKLVSVEPRDAVVAHGDSCDDITFFSSKLAAEAWAKEHGSDVEVRSMKDAVEHGAAFFGRFTAGL
jgi:alkylmercury lyase